MNTGPFQTSSDFFDLKQLMPGRLSGIGSERFYEGNEMHETLLEESTGTDKVKIYS